MGVPWFARFHLNHCAPELRGSNHYRGIPISLCCRLRTLAINSELDQLNDLNLSKLRDEPAVPRWSIERTMFLKVSYWVRYGTSSNEDPKEVNSTSTVKFVVVRYYSLFVALQL